MKQMTSFLTLLGLLMVAGCSQQGSAPVQPYKPLDTQPQSMEQQLWAQAPSELELSSVPGDPWSSTSTVDVYAVTFLWGTIVPGPAPTPIATDWSGDLRIGPAGRINLSSKISFEPGQDSVFVGDNPLVAAWKSLALNDVDGLSFLIVIDRSSPLTVMPHLAFTTAPVQLSFGMDHLNRFDTLIFVDAQNALLMISRKLKNTQCPRGAIAGLWLKADVRGASGKFEGKWMGSNSTQAGFMSGKFWTENVGGRRFFGQYTDLNDNPIGYVKGTWAYDDPRTCALCGSGRGSFTGVFTGLDTVAIGGIAAEFGDLTLPMTLLDLPYKGTWELWCPKQSADLNQY